MYKPRFKVVFTNERIITPSGFSIIGGMLNKSDFVKRCNRIPVDITPAKKDRKAEDGERNQRHGKDDAAICA